MTDQELQEQRRAKWRVTGPERALHTIEDAAEFISSVGMCLVYPVRPPVLAPTFMAACIGSDRDLPTQQNAFRDPRAAVASDLMVRLLRQRLAFEANFVGEGNLLLSAEVFPYFYSLQGDRNPKAAELDVKEKISTLARDAYAILQREGPLSKRKLIERLGGAPSEAALDRSLADLAVRLRIVRVDYRAGEGAFWDVLHRFAPDAVKQGAALSLAEGLSAMLSKYVDCVVAAEQSQIEDFFSHITSRSRAREAVNALLAAREFSFVQVGRKTLIEITPAPEPRSHPPLAKRKKYSPPTRVLEPR